MVSLAFGKRIRARSLAVVAAALCAFWLGTAEAQSTLRVPGERQGHALELEPHLLLSPFDAPADPSDGGYGLGARATIELLPDGFIDKLNDSVGIGFGLDWVHYSGVQGRAGCRRFEPTAAGVPVCVETGAHTSSYVFVPVVMQWNFWLHRQWSVFGEPGLAISHRSEGGFGVEPVIEGGGRFHFSDNVALTARVGYPAFSLGVSFFL